MNRTTLEAFLAVHRFGTIAAAAKKVNRSPAAVSVQLKGLEIELGVKLFVRSGRTLKFTREGEELVPLVEEVTSIFKEMKSLANRPQFLSLGVIHSTMTGILPGLLSRISSANKLVQVKVVTAISSDLVEMVEYETLDAAIITRPPKQHSVETLVVHHLFFEPLSLIIPADMEYVDLYHTLASSPYIAFDRSTWSGHLVDELLAKSNIKVIPAMEFNSMETIASIVSQGLGVAIIPQNYGTTWLSNFNIRVVPISGFEREVVLIEKKKALNRRPVLITAMLAYFKSMSASS